MTTIIIVGVFLFVITPIIYKWKSKQNNNNNPFKCKSLEEFKRRFILYHKQEYALNDDNTYWDITTSNTDGNQFGELVDNAIRIKLLKDFNQKFFEQINEDELIKEAKKLYEEDLTNSKTEVDI